MTCLQYVKVSGDVPWLQDNFSLLKRALEYLRDLFVPEMQMLSVPGPLWIDVCVRENFTSDSNAIMPIILEEWAQVEDVFGSAAYAEELRAEAAAIGVAMNRHLWDERDNDHYITQLNPDGTTRDFVDYDSQLLAIWSGIADEDRARSGERRHLDAHSSSLSPSPSSHRHMHTHKHTNRAILRRVDGGNCTHARLTYASERFYNGQEDCYIKGGWVCGDSIVSLARIGWADAHARKRMGDLRTFDEVLMAPLVEVRGEWHRAPTHKPLPYNSMRKHAHT